MTAPLPSAGYPVISWSLLAWGELTCRVTTATGAVQEAILLIPERIIATQISQDKPAFCTIERKLQFPVLISEIAEFGVGRGPDRGVGIEARIGSSACPEAPK